MYSEASKFLTNAWMKFRADLRANERVPLATALANLRDPDPDVRSNATRCLSRLGGEAAITALVSAMEDPEPRVRAGAALALGTLNAHAGLDALLHHLRHDDAGHVRTMCASFLDRFDDPRIPGAFLEALEDPEWKVVSSACVGLELLGSMEAASRLLPLLGHPQKFVRERACSALVALGRRDSRIITTLEELTADPELEERERFGQELTALLAEELPDETPPNQRTLRDLLEEARRPAPSDG